MGSFFSFYFYFGIIRVFFVLFISGVFILYLLFFYPLVIIFLYIVFNVYTFFQKFPASERVALFTLV